jgi:Prolyl oligopeptidase, N-terminal beta-propeller domain
MSDGCTAPPGDYRDPEAHLTERPSVPARRADQVDDYHGELVADPYRWLEDTNASETKD